MEEELLGSEPSQVRVLDKSAHFWIEVVLREVRQGAVSEAEGNSLALHGLLPDTDRHETI